MRQHGFIEEVSWSRARDTIAKVNPVLAGIIDRISPESDCTLFRATYPYGDEILHEEKFFLPKNNSGLTLIEDHPDKNIKKLRYSNTIPMGIVTKNSVELFIDISPTRRILFNVISEGSLFALWRVLDNEITYHATTSWTMTSGARSIFALPKISDEIAHKRLRKEFGIKSRAPKNLTEHWQIFSDLVSSPGFKGDWCAEVFFFSDSWLSHKNDPIWAEFNYYLLETAWKATEFWRNNFVFNTIYSDAQVEKNLKVNPQLADTVKHLFALGLGVVPGFGVLSDDSCAPVIELEKIYNSVYTIRNNYAAIFMGPGFCDQNKSVYYSLAYPTALEFSPRSRAPSSNMRDLLEVKHITDSVLNYFEGDARLIYSPLKRLPKKVDFQYFHTQSDKLGEIKSSVEIKDFDNGFADVLYRQSGKVFCETSPFFKGCIGLKQVGAVFE